MAQPMAAQSIRNIGVRGLIRPSQLDDSLVPDEAVTESVNFHFDRIGAATVRSGLTALGSTVLNARPAVGLHNALSGTALAVFSNGGSSTIYSYNGSAWSVSLDGGTASVKIRFVDFGSYTLALNFIYNTYSSMRFWNAGSSRHWHFTGNPLNPQNMWGYTPQVGEVYKSRIYLAGDTIPYGTTTNVSNPSRLFFSSVISSTGNITWSPTVDYVDINPGDGESITALRRFSLELLVFKPGYIYRFRTSGVEPEPLIKVGTRSHESIVEGKRGLYFHHDSGFYRYTGGYPQEISRPMADVVDAIPFSQYDDIVAWNDTDHIYWSIGNITITSEASGNVTIKNAVAVFTESTEVWTIYSYGADVRRGMIYNSGSALSRLVGLDNGVVATQNSGVTDLGEPIRYRLRTKWYEWENIITQKVLQELVGVCEKAQASQLAYQTDENYEWLPIGQMTKMINFFKDRNIKFKRIRFLVTGSSRFESPIFRGIEIVKGINEGIVE